MELTLIKEWIEACDALIGSYKNGISYGPICPLCIVNNKEPTRGYYMDGGVHCCPWEMFENTGHGCVRSLEPDLKDRIKRLHRWKRKLRKML